MPNDDFSPTDEAFLALLRQDVEPIPSATRAQLAARLAGAALGAPHVQPAAPASPRRGFWQAPGRIIALALPIGALLGATGYGLLDARRSAPRVLAVRVAPNPLPPLPRSVASSNVTTSASASPQARATQRAVPAPPAHTAEAKPPPPPSAISSAPVATAQDLASTPDDLALLERARTAFADGDTSASLELLRAHQHEYPGSALRQEREALTIRALVALGRAAEATRLADDFLERYPRSTLRPSVARAVGKKP